MQVQPRHKYAGADLGEGWCVPLHPTPDPPNFVAQIFFFGATLLCDIDKNFSTLQKS